MLTGFVIFASDDASIDYFQYRTEREIKMLRSRKKEHGKPQIACSVCGRTRRFMFPLRPVLFPMIPFEHRDERAKKECVSRVESRFNDFGLRYNKYVFHKALESVQL